MELELIQLFYCSLYTILTSSLIYAKYLYLYFPFYHIIKFPACQACIHSSLFAAYFQLVDSRATHCGIGYCGVVKCLGMGFTNEMLQKCYNVRKHTNDGFVKSGVRCSTPKSSY